MVTGDIIMTDRQHHLARVALCYRRREGEKIPRKGGPGITRSDLLVINKIDLAPLVGANLKVMEADALRMRVKRPFIFTNLKSGEGVDQIASFVIQKGGLAKSAALSLDR